MVSQPQPILIYGRPDCEDTEPVRERLNQLGIRFNEINVDEDEEAARFVEGVNNGYCSTPTILFGDGASIIVEPTSAELDDALRRAGYEV
jgi:mycoredoxin